MSEPGRPSPSARTESLALLVLAALALGAVLGTPWLIVPYRADQVWWESAAAFPRAVLALVALGALAEALRRWRGGGAVASEEIDSSQAHLPRALGVLLLFVVYALAVPVLGFAVGTALFLLAAARVVGLSWRAALWLALPMALVLWVVFVQLLKVAFGHGLLF